MPSLSTSKYNTLRTCPRLFYWEQVRFFMRVRQDGARGFGSLYHSGQEAWWKVAGAGDAPWADPDEPAVHAMRAIHEGSKHVDTDKYEVAKAEAMMMAYHGYYYDLEFERIGDGVEASFEVPLLDPDGVQVGNWKLIGRKDAIVHFDGRVKGSTVEHKTTASDITPGSEYWQRLEVDSQISSYIDAGQASGLNVGDVMWDASKKPNISPELKTPEDKIKWTKGKGCTTCGGKASGDVCAGSGKLTITTADKKLWKKYVINPEPGVDTVHMTCPECKGEGWKEKSRPTAAANLEDESVDDYRARIAEKIAENPDSFFRMAPITRTPAQIAESRGDLVAATVEIDGYWQRVRREAPNLEHPRARLVFPRNTQVCLSIYGRRCDFLDVCAGTIADPAQSPLYKIKEKPTTNGAKK